MLTLRRIGHSTQSVSKNTQPFMKMRRILRLAPASIYPRALEFEVAQSCSAKRLMCWKTRQ